MNHLIKMTIDDDGEIIEVEDQKWCLSSPAGNDAGRRTFAVRLKRQGVDTPTIHKMLGNKTLETTLRLIETDTIDMLKIADMAF
ncbi:hypothetical protein BCT75_04235 [Vibrio lentus]|uniref:hypothetical protein n=1 Tax=Vibrio lentus TaxID=136468 RepID=UPI000CA9DD36|nr:hypothetical protein [Vibrio lentus]PML45598.1 hypothetical protein BCT75_04235 [Vibrio lentus]